MNSMVILTFLLIYSSSEGIMGIMTWEYTQQGGAPLH